MKVTLGNEMQKLNKAICYPYCDCVGIDKESELSMNKNISEIHKRFKNELLPKLNMFTDFKVIKIYKNSSDLGYYRKNSYKRPLIKLNVPTMREYVSDRTPLDLIIETTILHELGHAIQDYTGKYFNENSAEAFAYHYYYYEEIIKI